MCVFPSLSPFSSPEAACSPRPPTVSPRPAHPVPVALASTFLRSQETHGLASTVNAHLPRGGRRKIRFSRSFTDPGRPARLSGGWRNRGPREDRTSLGPKRGSEPPSESVPFTRVDSEARALLAVVQTPLPLLVLPPWDCSPGQDHRLCRAESGGAGPRHCPGPGGPSCSSAPAGSRWPLVSPSADPGLSPAAAGPDPPGTGAARTWHL